mgnify:CR=1 FL=1
MKKLELRKLIREEVSEALSEAKEFEADEKTVGDLIAFLSKLNPKLKIQGRASIESGYSSSGADPADYCSFSVKGNMLVIDVGGEETDYYG